MKKRLQGLIAGVLIGAMLTSGVVFAKQASETISVIYDNIKILIDGKEYQSTDVNGNVVEPFIYNGTTYLPVRAIANAFDKEVDWEAQTSTVTLGSKNYDWLDQMGYADYDTTGGDNIISTIENNTKSADGMKYDRGIKFFLSQSNDYPGYVENNDGTYESWQEVEYLLNGNYEKFTGTLTYIRGNEEQNSLIKIYGDGNLIYTSPIMTSGTKSTSFDIDIKNFKVLKIKAFVPNLDYRYANEFAVVGIADARLSKK